MRGVVGELRSPQPLIVYLPGLYQEDDLARALTGAFDDAYAPVLSTIDNLAAYLDPALTPVDFLDWLAGWVGLVLDETWPIERRRAIVAVASQIYRRRGTAAGLSMQLKLLTAGDVAVSDSGGATWSKSPGSKPPGDASYTLSVRVKPAKKESIDAAKLDALVAAAKPAHVTHTVETGDKPAA
ncbi:MAG TPA: phage tail protein [Candidatus Limnocylindrales bacterium]|nr:phage tail protein [Candidatus Limnocylindrales bacterium]